MRNQQTAISKQLPANSRQKSGFLKRLSTESRMLNARVLNEKGIALVVVLILSVIALATMAGLIYMVTSGTQISGIQKRYNTALEAGIGGIDVTYQVIGARGDPSIPNISFNFSAAFTDVCMADKLNNPTFIGTTYNWANCNQAAATSPAIVPATPSTYDMTLQVGTDPIYTVYAKIVNTVEGNSGGDEGLLKSGVVNSNSGEVTVMSIPYLYTIEIDAQNAANPAERARLSVLYQY